MEKQVKRMEEEAEHTRRAIAEKIGALESQVQKTVEELKSKAEETVENVKEAATSVKNAFDIKQHVEKHPLFAVGLSAGAGFVIGHWASRKWFDLNESVSWNFEPVPETSSAREGESRTWRPEGISTSSPEEAAPRQFAREKETNRPHTPSRLTRLLGEFTSEFDEEIQLVKGMVIGAGMRYFTNLIKNAVPKIAPQVEQVLDSATEKLGGTVIMNEGAESKGSRDREQNPFSRPESSVNAYDQERFEERIKQTHL